MRLGPFVGRVETSAFLVDPGHIGRPEALRRVAEAWVPGARLLEYGDRLLLLLPEPVSVRAERGPGLPVRAADGALLVSDGGREVVVRPEQLRAVDLSTVIDLGDPRVQQLAPVRPPPRPAPPPVYAAPPPTPALRARAAVGAPDTAQARRAERLVEAAQRRPRSGTFARLVAKSAAGPVLGRRHQRYLRELTQDFEKGSWDSALRGAIGLGGAGGTLSLRLPGRRTGRLEPSRSAAAPGRSVPYGATVHQHLEQLYRSAAQQLEREGRHLLAAFVYADLLGRPAEAVDLLERVGSFGEAAELAEARQLDPAIAVRLWWRAGQRERALRVARARGAFAAALVRLQDADPAASLELRRAWVQDRRAAGDHLGAVEAAWVNPELRDEVMGDVVDGIAAGGAGSGRLLAHWLEHAPSADAVASARTLLASAPDQGSARGAFVSALAGHQVGVEAWDRELTSLALVALARGDAEVAARTLGEVSARLQERADPVLKADLPRLRPPVWSLDEPLDVDLTLTGTVTIHDAVALGHNDVLVALGELGVRLVTRDGRTKVAWDAPTHRIVMADHGGRALFVTDRAPRFDVHQVDLPHGRPVAMPVLDVLPLDTYDGGRPVLMSDRGIEWVELGSGRWRVVWRELTEPGHLPHLASRIPGHLTALFTDRELNAWHWDLPSVALRSRGIFEAAQHMAVVATGDVARLEQSHGTAALHWHSPFGHRMTTQTHYLSGEAEVIASGTRFALVDRRRDDATLLVHAAVDAPVSAVVRVPGTAVLFRAWADLMTVGHPHGRVVVLDAERHEVVADLVLHP